MHWLELEWSSWSVEKSGNEVRVLWTRLKVEYYHKVLYQKALGPGWTFI
jgi:hypothetical protein